MRIIAGTARGHRAENAAGHGCHTPHGGPRERGHVQRRAVPCAGRACAGRIRRLWASLGWRRSAAGLRRAFFWTNRARLAPWCAKMPLPRGLPKGPACCKQAPGLPCPACRRRSTSFCWTALPPRHRGGHSARCGACAGAGRRGAGRDRVRCAAARGVRRASPGKAIPVRHGACLEVYALCRGRPIGREKGETSCASPSARAASHR